MCECNYTEKKFRGLSATGTQTVISGAGAASGIIAGAIIGGPIGAAIGGAISIGSSLIASIFSPDYTKIYATNDANLAEKLGVANVNGWLALPAASKVPAVQEFFIKNWQTIWNGLVQGCSQPNLGVAGQNCITDRLPTGKYPFTDLLSQIQNDPNIVTQVGNVTFVDPLTGTQITVTPNNPVSSAVNSVVGSPNLLWYGLGALAIIWLID